MSTWSFKNEECSTSPRTVTGGYSPGWVWLVRIFLGFLLFQLEIHVEATITNPPPSWVQPPREMVDGLQWSKALDKTASPKSRNPASQSSSKPIAVVSLQPEQPVVVLHTEEGFVPSRLVLQTNKDYMFYLVNVSQQNRLAHYLFDGLGYRGKMEFGEVVRLKVRVLVNHEFLLHCPESGKTVTLTFDEKF